ncbi:MAG TPA: hypothetical protein DCY20_10635 [Firmicutes bacterium]|nr:hypothetical protein [Bacillota bacterium]
MHLGNDLVRIVENSFVETHSEIVCEFDKKKGSIIASHFVSKIGATIYQQCFSQEAGYALNGLNISEDGKWSHKDFLVDCSITNMTPIVSKAKQKVISVHSSMSVAIESVGDPGLISFGKHFGKLLCIKSDNCLFLNAVNQRTKSRRTQYIDHRLNQMLQLLNSQPAVSTAFYVVFWPSPHDHLWDNFSKEILVNWIEAYEITQNRQTLKYEFKKLT